MHRVVSRTAINANQTQFKLRRNLRRSPRRTNPHVTLADLFFIDLLLTQKVPQNRFRPPILQSPHCKDRDTTQTEIQTFTRATTCPCPCHTGTVSFQQETCSNNFQQITGILSGCLLFSFSRVLGSFTTIETRIQCDELLQLSHQHSFVHCDDDPTLHRSSPKPSWTRN